MKKRMNLLSNGVEIKPITNARVDKWELPVRKLAHYGLFTCGGFILYWVVKKCFSAKYATLVSISLGMLLACSDEYHQFYSQNRGPKLSDVGIDTLGIVSGVFLAIILERMIQKFYHKKSLKNNCYLLTVKSIQNRKECD